MKLEQAIAAYIAKFDEGPPIFGLDPDEAVRRIQAAIEEGKPLRTGAETEIPEGARL